MAIPQVTCNSDIELSYSASPQIVSLGATATGSPFSWKWTILSVPTGSEANIGTNGDFIDGIATVQTPSLSLTASVDGGYVFQCIATNTNGSSNPEIDLSNCEQQITIKTHWYQLYLPGDFSRNWGQHLIDKTFRIIESILHLHEINLSNPHVTTKTQVGLGSVTDDAQLKRAASDFTTFTAKAPIALDDIILIEDSTNTYNKKKALVSAIVDKVGLNNVTDDAQLKRSAGDFNSFLLKADPIAGDILLLEDSVESFAKKKISFSSFVGTLDFVPQVKNLRYVDGNRTDTYTPDGSILKPYLTVTLALAAITGATVSNPYTIIIFPKSPYYSEDIILKPFVYLEGANRDSVIFNREGPSIVVDVASNDDRYCVSNLTIINTSSTLYNINIISCAAVGVIIDLRDIIAINTSYGSMIYAWKHQVRCWNVQSNKITHVGNASHSLTLGNCRVATKVQITDGAILNLYGENYIGSLESGTTNYLNSSSLIKNDSGISGTTITSALNNVCESDDARLSDDRISSGLRTATTVVAVSAATAPTAGQILMASSATSASWQTSSSSGDLSIEMLNKAPSTALTKNVNGFDAVGYPGIDEPGDMFEEFYVSKPGVYFVMVKVNFCIDVGTGAEFRLVFDYDTTPIYVTDASWKLYNALVPTPVLISNFVCTVNLAVGTHNVKIDWSAITGSTISTSPNYFNWKIQAIYTGGLGLPVVMLNKAPIAGRVTSGTSFTGIGYPVVPEPGDMYEILSPSVVAGVYFLVVKICIGVGAGANLGKFRLVFDYDTTPIYVTDNSWQIYTTSSNTYEYEFTGMVTLPSLPIGDHNVKIEWRAYTGSNFGAGTECSWKIQALLITT